MRSFIRLLPAFIVVVSGFALYQAFAAVLFAIGKDWPMAGLYALLAIAGMVIARTLWLNRAKLARPPQ